MATKVQQINVASPDQVEGAVSGYIAQGFVVSSRTADSVTLFKKKEFNILWAVIGLVLCVLPLLVYAIIYATQSDEMIVIRVGPVPGPTGSTGREVLWSEDRQWWWDGVKWRDAATEAPPGVPLSDDGRFWWDGSTWRAVASKALSEESRAAPPGPEGPPQT